MAMRVIPVLDLQGGLVVHAKGGERSRYGTLQSVLTKAPDPLSLTRAFREWLGLTEVYVADLDAIQGKGDNFQPLEGLILRDKGIQLLVDAGVRRAESVQRLFALGVSKVIVASEVLEGLDAVVEIIQVTGTRGLVFSIDMRGRRTLWRSDQGAISDPRGVALQVAKLGITEMILLEMDRIGTGIGVDTEVVADLVQTVPGVGFIVGGGVKDVTDLITLHRIGASGALVATALHEGRITKEDLARVASLPGRRRQA